jgi:predicted RNA-binding protein with PIN domain
MPYLVDGSNLLGSTPGLRIERRGDRRKLVRLVLRSPSARRKGATFVFDGPPGAGPSRLSLGRGTEVRYAGPRSDADSVIVRMMERAERNHYVLVTDDRELRERAGILGIARLSCREFLGMLRREEREAREDESVEERPDRPLSEEEVDAWLDYFGRNREE